MSLQDYANQVPPDPNAPGGPAPDPRTLARPPSPPPPPSVDIQARPVPTSRETPQGGDTADLGDGAGTSGDTGATPTPGFWRDNVAPAMYAPHQANRAPREWREPSWQVKAQQSYDGIMGGVMAPAPYESYPMIASAGGQLAQWESPGVAGPARLAGSLAGRFAPILDMLSGGKFSKNFNAASLGRMKLEQEQMQMNITKAYYAHQQQMIDYGSVLHEAALGAITPEEAKRRLENHIYLNSDQILNEILQNKGLGSAERFLQWRDARMNDMLAGGTSIRKASGGAGGGIGTNEILQSLGEQPVADGGTGGIDFPSLPDNQTAQAGQTGAPPVPSSPAPDASYTDNLKKTQGLTDQEAEIAQGLVNGEQDGNYQNLVKNAAKDRNLLAAKAKIDRAADTMRASVHRIAHGSDDRDTKINQISNISPQLGDKLRGLLDYSIDPNKDLGTVHDRKSIMDFAHEVDPSYKSDNYRIAQKYHDPNTREGLVVQRVGSLTGALGSLNSSLTRLPEDQKIPLNQIEDLIADRYSGDPRWQEAYSAIRNVAQEVAAIESGSGRPPVSLVNNMVRHMMQTGSPAQIRSQIMTDVRSAHAYIKPIQEQWRLDTGNPTGKLPFLSQGVEDQIGAYLRSNPYTGVMPADAPASLLAVGRQQPKTFPSWLQRTTRDHPGQDLPPLTKQQITQGWDKLDELTKKGDPESMRQAQWLRERMGIFADRGSLD
jgi:hypothetical protein